MTQNADNADDNVLHRADASYRSLFENAAHGMYRSSPDGKQLRANPALVRLNGYGSEAEMLAAVNDIATEWYVDPERRDEFKRRVETDGRVRDFESEIYRHKTRERIWISESAWVVRDQDGRALFYEGIVEEITARKRVEIALAAAKAEAERLAADYRSIRDNAILGFYRAMPDGSLIAANPALVAFDGYTDEAEWLVGVSTSGESWYVEPDRRAEFRGLLERDGRVEKFESEVHRHRTREKVWISESAWTVRDADGATLYFEGMVEDITARKRAEDALREAKAEAEAASAAKSDFLAVMSHELRTPLTAIIGLAEVIEGKFFGPDDPRYFEFAGRIGQSGTHLLALINDILDLSKIDAGKVELHESEVDLAAMAEDAVKLFDASAGKGGVALALAPGFPALRLRADAKRLKQVAMNLVSNAIKFTPKGGRVTIGASVDADAIRFWVQDTGIGMTESESKRAMVPFVQIDDGATRKHGGTGLGLPISKELVALHGGELIVTSEKGKGTRMSVELPVERSVRPSA